MRSTFHITFALILLGLLVTFAEPASAMDTSCDGAQVSQTNTLGPGPEQRCIKPGTGAREWFKDCPTCPEMVVIPAGSFMMGSERADNAKPIHRVTIAKLFAVGKYSVTRGEFAAFVNDSGYTMQAGCVAFKFVQGVLGATVGSNASWNSAGFDQSDRHPVVCVNWGDARSYVDWLSKKSGEAYRLLTEAEYEYSARAGTTTPYFWGEYIGRNQANCSECGSQWEKAGTAPVGSFAGNNFGLHDVHGNAATWVEDCYHPNYQDAPTDGSAWLLGNCTKRVYRGGSWIDKLSLLDAASRNDASPLVRFNTVGIRVVRALTR
jgi:formylglycine-generating enzyme required for sulfatase activity